MFAFKKRFGKELNKFEREREREILFHIFLSGHVVRDTLILV